MARKGFWGKFDDLMSSLPDHIDNEINTVGSDNSIYTSNKSVIQTSSFGKSSTTVKQDGKKIVISTVNGKTVIKVDGVEYLPKK